jgi:hypothetical protein
MKFSVGIPYKKFQENWLLAGQTLDKGINEITSPCSHFLTGYFDSGHFHIKQLRISEFLENWWM